MSNVIPGEAVKTIDIPVPLKVQDDLEPKLSADLDARGHSLQGVKNVQCETVNGEDLASLVKGSLSSERAESDKRYAAVTHTHVEFNKVEALIDRKIADAAPKVEYALKDHTHPVSVTPLSNIEKGAKIKELLDAELCPLQHSHPRVDEALVALQSSVSALKNILDGFAAKSVVDALVANVKDLEAALTEEIKKVAASIPVIPKEDVEIVGAKFCLVPYKCAGKKLKEKMAVDFNGNQINAEVTLRGRSIQLGETFSPGDLLVLPPNCLVLFRFS